MTFAIYTKGAGVAFTEVHVTANPAAFESATEELGYSQVPVVIYATENIEDHLSGSDPDRIARVIRIETRMWEGALA